MLMRAAAGQAPLSFVASASARAAGAARFRHRPCGQGLPSEGVLIQSVTEVIVNSDNVEGLAYAAWSARSAVLVRTWLPALDQGCDSLRDLAFRRTAANGDT